MLWKYLRKFPKFSSSASKKVETKKCNFSKNRLCDFLEFFNYIKASISGADTQYSCRVLKIITICWISI